MAVGAAMLGGRTGGELGVLGISVAIRTTTTFKDDVTLLSWCDKVDGMVRRAKRTGPHPRVSRVSRASVNACVSSVQVPRAVSLEGAELSFRLFEWLERQGHYTRGRAPIQGLARRQLHTTDSKMQPAAPCPPAGRVRHMSPGLREGRVRGNKVGWLVRAKRAIRTSDEGREQGYERGQWGRGGKPGELNDEIKRTQRCELRAKGEGRHAIALARTLCTHIVLSARRLVVARG